MTTTILNPELRLLIQQGSSLLEEKRAADKIKEQELEKEYQQARHRDWAKALQPLYDDIPESLWQYVRYDGDTYPGNSGINHHSVYIDAIPHVNIKVYLDYGELFYKPQRAFGIEDCDDGYYVKYVTDGTYTDILLALAHASELMESNAEFDSKAEAATLEDQREREEANQQPTTPYHDIQFQIHQGNFEKATALALLQIAKHLDPANRSLPY